MKDENQLKHYHVCLSPSIFRDNTSFDVHEDIDKGDPFPVANPLHSVLLELTLGMIKILLETKCTRKENCDLYFSALNCKSIPVKMYSHFRDLIYNEEFQLDKESESIGIEYLSELLLDDGINSGFLFCTQYDIDIIVEALQTKTLGGIWTFLCIVNSKDDEVSLSNEFQNEPIIFSRTDDVREKWLSTFKKKYLLVELRIQGIPMKQQKSDHSTDSYDVPLLCTASSWKISGNIFGPRVDTLSFKWRKNDPQSNIYCHYQLIASYPVVVLEPNSNVSKCLISFIGKGRAATIELKTENPTDSATHMIVMQGSQTYIHVINNTRMYTMQCQLSRTISEEYRYNQLYSLVSQQNFIHCSIFDNSSKYKIEDAARNNLITMKYNGLQYMAPKIVEKITRIFPLQYDRESILWNEEIPQTILHALQPLYKIIYKDNIREADVDQARVFLADAHRSCSMNETYYFPQLKDDHKKRHYLHKRFWCDIRTLLRSFNAERFLTMTDELWPNFFYNPEEEDKSLAPRDFRGNVLCPFNAEDDIVVVSLGSIIQDKPSYHDQENIFPVGYHIIRKLDSITGLGKDCKYHFEVKSGGDEPQFIITCDKLPDQIFSGKSPLAAYRSLLISVDQGSTSGLTEAEGIDAFGFNRYTIKFAIAERPKADKIDRPLFPHQYASRRKRQTSADLSETTFETDSLEMGVQRRNAFESTSVAFAIQSQSQYSHNRDLAALQQKEQLRSTIEGFVWNENMSLLDLHKWRMEKCSELRFGFAGTHKALFTNMYSDEALIMDNIVKQDPIGKKKNKKRKLPNSEGRNKRRRK